MKEFAKEFYTGTAWAACRKAYRKKAGGLCEECLSKGLITAGEIVHHKIPISPDNINDPTITLNFDNLELVCRECHADIHRRREKRYKVDEDGRVIIAAV